MKHLQNSTTIQKFVVTYEQSEEFHQLKREIFNNHIYYFDASVPDPVIIDAGAHIGLATLYFKQFYPTASITAIEPNPVSFKIMEQNVVQNRLEDVRLVSAALANHTSTSSQPTQNFFVDQSSDRWYSTGGFVKGSWIGHQKSEILQVATITLADLISTPVDLLKLDIEGAEQEVLASSRSVLPLVKQLIVEFHPHPGQSLPALIRLLEPFFKLSFLKKGKEVDPLRTSGLIIIEGTALKMPE